MQPVAAESALEEAATAAELQQLSEKTLKFTVKIGCFALVHDVDGCPEIMIVTPSPFAADHSGRGSGSIGSGRREAQHDGRVATGAALSSHTSKPFDQQMADIYETV